MVTVMCQETFLYYIVVDLCMNDLRFGVIFLNIVILEFMCMSVFRSEEVADV